MQNPDATRASAPGNNDHLEGVVLPTDYIPQVEIALAHDHERAANYFKHTLIGDPLADETLEECSSLTRAELYLFVQAGMDGDKAALADAPAALREFFDQVDELPDWFHETDSMPGVRSFHRNSSLILGAMVGGVLVEGFTTNISKSFFLSGRLRDQGVRRLKQNNRHMLEIFMPGGMDRLGDGFKLSVRIRLVHAHIRRLLRESGDWDIEAWGVPVSSAHLGFAIAAFSARLLHHARRLGAQFTDEERASFMQVWRRSGYVMGIPETILYHDEADALKVFEIGRMCEPPIGLESIAMANALENSAPVVVGIADPSQRRSLAKYVYNVSGALIGKEMAAALRYPKRNTLGVLPMFRLDVRYKRLMARLFPSYAARMKQNDFTGMLGASAYDEAGLTYGWPDNVYAERSSRW
ncbi:MAG: oxygenase MpaB family protein [Chloroflexota bacterium]|nr:oxygenase MpaB family protein [Chloroflexota bacterium]MDE2885349.1 oxygenase MpaB family protein [Chloroflexota bacterium]